MDKIASLQRRIERVAQLATAGNGAAIELLCLLQDRHFNLTAREHV